MARRPKLTRGAPTRYKQLGVKLTPEERKTITKVAKGLGLDSSSFARVFLLPAAEQAQKLLSQGIPLRSSDFREQAIEVIRRTISEELADKTDAMARDEFFPEDDL